MVKRSSSPVNKLALPHTSPLAREQIAIWLLFGGLALLLYVNGLDDIIARAVYHPAEQWAWLLREYGALAVGVLGTGSLIALFLPNIWETHPLFYRSCATLVITIVLGAGLFNQVIVQEVADRARPRETVLAQPSHTLSAEFSGNSMPSGHAAMGYALAAPFFVLRRRKPLLASSSLGLGLATGTIIGMARMTLGAHFASDVLVAGALTLSVASLAAWSLQHWPRIPRRALAAVVLAGGAVAVLGNHFTVNLNKELPGAFRRIDLPCEVAAVYSTSTTVPTLKATVTGYGAPISQLEFVEKEGVIKLQTSHGLYHGISCSARLNMPIGPYE